MKLTAKQVIFENFSYKLVALFISLILWMTILGRRDFQVTKNIELDLVPPTGMVLQSQSTEHVKVMVGGPRTALRKFLDSGTSPVLTSELPPSPEGVRRVAISPQKLDLPFGAKVISINPSEVEVRLQKQ